MCDVERRPQPGYSLIYFINKNNYEYDHKKESTEKNLKSFDYLFRSGAASFLQLYQVEQRQGWWRESRNDTSIWGLPELNQQNRFILSWYYRPELLLLLLTSL